MDGGERAFLELLRLDGQHTTAVHSVLLHSNTGPSKVEARNTAKADAHQGHHACTPMCIVADF
jgi:hypothetical protein